jgi:hypothetical protein
MSDLMTHGVLQMPPDMWGDDPLDIAQRHSRYVAASDRIYELERELAEAKRDAERYRWLRSYRGISIDEVYMYGGNEELDREIDSGIKNGITRAAEGK